MTKDGGISIHALLAESDVNPFTANDIIAISIHALLAESDSTGVIYFWNRKDFYPRSPCGERRPSVGKSGQNIAISIHALLAESDLLIAPT